MNTKTNTRPVYIVREPGDDECYIGRADSADSAMSLALDYADGKGWDTEGVDAPELAEMAFDDVDGEVMRDVWIVTGIDTRD